MGHCKGLRFSQLLFNAAQSVVRFNSHTVSVGFKNFMSIDCIALSQRCALALFVKQQSFDSKLSG